MTRFRQALAHFPVIDGGRLSAPPRAFWRMVLFFTTISFLLSSIFAAEAACFCVRSQSAVSVGASAPVERDVGAEAAHRVAREQRIGADVDDLRLGARCALRPGSTARRTR